MNFKISDISCVASDFDQGLKYFLNNKEKGNKDLIKGLDSENIKCIVLNVKKIVDENLKGKIDDDITLLDFKKNLESVLMNDESLYSFGLISKINEIYDNDNRNNIHNMNETIKEYYELLQKSPLILFNWSPLLGFKVKKVTKNVETLTGYSDNDFIEGDILFNDIIHPDDIERIKEEVSEYTNECFKSEFEQEYRIITKDGSVKTIYDKTLVKYDEEGNVINLYGFIYDITKKNEIENEIKIKSDQLNYLLNHDDKSGLPNQFKCKEDMEKNEIEHLIIFKIRDFDKVNALFGRDGAEEILLDLINKYGELKNKFGMLGLELYRLSSTEFGITLKIGDYLHINANQLMLDISSFLKNVKIEYNGVELPMNHSIGAKFYSEDGNLLNKAQIALEESKKIINGEDQIMIYTKGLDERLSLEYNGFYSWIKKIKNTLSKQLNNQEGNLKVYYQGIINNKTGEIKKYESLIRYEENETKIIVPPFHFLDHVKQARLISKLTKVVLMDNIKILKENPDISISINFTNDDLKNKELISYLIKELESSNIEKSRINIEILEDISILDDNFYENILDLKDNGFKISIDDFGTGYSNFERLIKIKPDFVKIDGSLINGILNCKEKEEIVKSIVIMSHGLGSEVIAEFVDSLEVQEKIIELGVDYSQGFYFSEPKPFDEHKKED